MKILIQAAEDLNPGEDLNHKFVPANSARPRRASCRHKVASDQQEKREGKAPPLYLIMSETNSGNEQGELSVVPEIVDMKHTASAASEMSTSVSAHMDIASLHHLTLYSLPPQIVSVSATIGSSSD